ncbi:bifunctional hydroxymethylpyrimidine kinase/phosphomethylpyrimidine kinase [Bifidobacterium sp. ESL0800]|uniref:bifunctional hydroxymethylpyrimidine kinase/phosphomethylpyrimidine kinase n=1 Tax=Bifidobacterium sp. ESL0800 TaxID=2983236 RepID=UPI0023F7CE88|nr:bifunctional hydroxymethylpyrimidine kinase/phosphomethylpyrimidine kinase [Bifidobacterium sp. ESL0800]WEV75033.1 bifunctional hydroxymethylpyrimidine kinase/phosphomethylpyrimidine kinase [Bifidobacterium sp. ESL0800]
MSQRTTQSASGVHSYQLPTVLSIAGSDSSGGAGIQADLKTFMACDVYGMSAITSITAQNTTGVRASAATSPELLAEQINIVFEDIRPDAVKIGMVPSAELIEVIADRLRHFNATNIVVDPVMIASSGERLSSKASVDALCTKLLPLATLVTPNIPEAETIANLGTRPVRDCDTTPTHELIISDEASTITAARTICECCGGCAVLIKGGHRRGAANDLLFDNGEHTWFRHTRIANPNTHGTGCTLSSAIAAGLAKGESLTEAVQNAKDYLTGCIAAGLDLGAGSGPMDHAWKWHDNQN